MCAIVCTLALAIPAAARAATVFGALPLTVTQVSDTALTLDSNSPATSGPHAMYVSYRITNTGATTLTNLSATIAGFSGGIALGGGQAATQYVGNLAPGASATLYWFITYPSTFGVRNVLTVTVTDGAGGTASGSAPVVTYSMISAQAGGQTTTAAIGAGAVVGQLIPLDVTFQFKGWKQGDTFDLQPAGNSNFPAGCFQLVKDSIGTVDPNLDATIVPGTTNRTYFSAVSASLGGGSSWNVSVRYWFRYLCSGTTTTPLPYSNELSGTQLKYAANYGSGSGVPSPIPPAPSPSASFTFGKTASSVQLASGGSDTYTVAVKNVSTFDVTIDSIVDVLPSGVTFAGIAAGSAVTAANSGSVPAAGATGTLVFRGLPGTSYAIAAGTTLNLIYNVTLTSTAGQYVNNAAGYVATTSIGAGSATVTVGTADVSLAKSGPTGAALSDTLRYAVTVSNAGPSTAYQVVAVDSLPSGVTFVRATNGGTLSGGLVTWPAVASIVAGSSVVDSVLVVAPTSAATIVNVARASSPSYDPNAANNNGSAAASQVSTVVTVAVTVSPKGTGSATKKLPGTKYSQLFTVTNNSVAAGTYNLLASITGTPTFITIDSLTGSGITTRVRPDSVQVPLAARSSTGYTVWYTIAMSTTDTSVDVEGLRARNVTTTSVTDTGYVQLQRATPSLTLKKTVTPTGVVSPGSLLTYNVAFGNKGTYDAAQVVVWDNVPAAVSFQLGSSTQTLPSGVTATVTYSSDGGTTWTYVPVSAGCGAPAGYDSCVTQVRWTLSGSVPPALSSGTVSFVARVR